MSWEQRNDQPWRNALIGLARDAAPYEACGVITVYGQVVQCRNMIRTADPRATVEFQMHPDDVILVWPYAAAVWHTHPGGSLEPSTRDSHGHPETTMLGDIMGMVIATTDDVRVVIPW